MKKLALLILFLITVITLTTKLIFAPDNTETPVLTAPRPLVPESFSLAIPKQYFQTFNNCGPATLSMVLAYYQIDHSQKVIGDRLRPYQNQQGSNDIKSVSMEKLAKYAEELNLTAIHRSNGDLTIVKALVSKNIPVITRTLLTKDNDIGHYRIITGYNENQKELIQSDSYQGANRRYSYDEFLKLWEPYGYEYLVITRPEQEDIVKQALGQNWEEEKAWQGLLEKAESANSLFNEAVAQYHLGNYEAAKKAYEKAAPYLPARTLWYQLEPILTYQKLGEHETVFKITNQILNTGNRAYPELYFIQAQIYQAQNNIPAARERLAQALFYDPYYEEAQNLLSRINSR